MNYNEELKDRLFLLFNHSMRGGLVKNQADFAKKIGITPQF